MVSHLGKALVAIRFMKKQQVIGGHGKSKPRHGFGGQRVKDYHGSGFDPRPV